MSQTEMILHDYNSSASLDKQSTLYQDIRVLESMVVVVIISDERSEVPETVELRRVPP